jgi:hypothetical protein
VPNAARRAASKLESYPEMKTSRSEAQNRIQMRSKKSGLPRGVTLNNNGQFQARIFANGRSVALGSYDTAQKAAKVYAAAKLRYRSAKWPEANPKANRAPERAQPAHSDPVTEKPTGIRAREPQPVPAAPAALTPEPPAREPAAEPQGVPDAIPAPARAAQPGCPCSYCSKPGPGQPHDCCPACGSALYGPVGSSDSALCRQCGFQFQPRLPNGLSRADLASYNGGKGGPAQMHAPAFLQAVGRTRGFGGR